MPTLIGLSLFRRPVSHRHLLSYQRPWLPWSGRYRGSLQVRLQVTLNLFCFFSLSFWCYAPYSSSFLCYLLFLPPNETMRAWLQKKACFGKLQMRWKWHDKHLEAMYLFLSPFSFLCPYLLLLFSSFSGLFTSVIIVFCIVLASPPSTAALPQSRNALYIQSVFSCCRRHRTLCLICYPQLWNKKLLKKFCEVSDILVCVYEKGLNGSKYNQRGLRLHSSWCPCHIN